MNRREFIAGSIALGIVSVIPTKTYRERVLLDYNSNYFDEYGPVYRRGLCTDIPPYCIYPVAECDVQFSYCISHDQWVKSAKLLSSGQLEVTFHESRHWNKSLPISTIIDDWKINCYDESGICLKVLNKDNIGLT